MKDFRNKIAVITGAGTGMGRALARQLAKEGCHLALCDVLMDNLEETSHLARTGSRDEIRISTHECDVSDETQMLAFRDAVAEQHETRSINLLFNNAGIGGGGSFLNDPRKIWEKTFGVCWFGVYYGSRAFLPMLVESDEGYIVNTSSVNGFWASLGPHTSHTAYSASKFAVKGFTEALVTELRLNAPHVKAAVVMPGHIGTGIAKNTARILGFNKPEDMTEEELDGVRERMSRMGFDASGMNDDQIRKLIAQQGEQFEKAAPMTAAEAADVILDGVREERWRILVGKDAELLDRLVREAPERAYDSDFAANVFRNSQNSTQKGE